MLFRSRSGAAGRSSRARGLIPPPCPLRSSAAICRATYTLLNEVIVPSIQKDRILVIINQADMAMKGYHWDYENNTPDDRLIDFLEEQAISIQKRVKEATGVEIIKPVYYSAEYNWNIKTVFDFIIDHMPRKRRIIT